MSRQELRDLIAAKGVSISKLSRQVDIHPDTINNFIKGKSEIGVDKYEKLIEFLTGYSPAKQLLLQGLISAKLVAIA